MLCQLLTKAQRVPCKNAMPFHFQRWHTLDTSDPSGNTFWTVGVRWQPAQVVGNHNGATDDPANGLAGATASSLFTSTQQALTAEPVPVGMSAILWLSAHIALSQLEAISGSDVWPFWWRWTALVDGAVQGPRLMLCGGARGEWEGHVKNTPEPYIGFNQWGGMEVDGTLPVPLLVRSGQRVEFQLTPGTPDGAGVRNSAIRLRAHGWWWHGDERGCGCGC